MPRFYFSRGRGHETAGWRRQLIWLVEAGAIGALLGLLRLLPLRTSLALAAALGGVLARFSPRLDKVRANLSVVFPDIDRERLRRITRASFRNVGVAVAELASLERIWRARERRIEFRELPGAVTPSAARRTIFVTGHIGAWQLTPLLGAQYDFTVPVIYAPEQNPYVDRMLASLRRAFRSPLVSRDGGLRVLMRALDAGQCIGMTVDTRLDSGEPVPFFGEDALTNTAPARLALRYDIDLVPVIAERLPDARYRINIHPPVRPRDPQAARHDQVLDMSAQINKLLERWIVEQPDQWLCLKRRWPKAVYRRLQN